ncbi:MAG: bifunctional hydroxymethylpyrimidine kinase/phosphomethylpyrimidine kinase [Armatimonadota bacterium]|nr:bifunctional hydroxymethylpyrimidine kinase/phosphomethylpyrimidine kinase [Armatimonadota bacterium]MDR7532716.1 bifunctional hydroxymethylpyrimidine kinase/phosphomethylpyrimidine kinase [Armatimonadota bacterium]MDR7535336.1 bifunctional hydroxymethylpyrimidine kinase/phosphomethylpyrimidine kinase [Armatimonadota bacterium]
MTGIPRALTIAGSDSGGGAGIQADLKTFSALGVFGMTAITALTAQNTVGVVGVVEVAPEFVARQIDAVVADIGVDAVKTGMLASASIIEAVADRLRTHRLDVVVVDPVMIAKSGAPLLRPDAVDALRTVLLPLATVLTPNLHEARALLGREIRTPDEMEDAARRLHALGPRAVVVKGGHLETEPTDVLWDGQRLVRLRTERIATPHTHGTGCIFASAIAAELAKGRGLEDAVRRAKAFVTAAIWAALPLGRGHGPANPMHGQIPAAADVL